MRSIARSYLAILVIVAIGGSPVMAARRRALGVVVQTDRGHIDTTNAVMGADIYSCIPAIRLTPTTVEYSA